MIDTHLLTLAIWVFTLSCLIATGLAIAVVAFASLTKRGRRMHRPRPLGSRRDGRETDAWAGSRPTSAGSRHSRRAGDCGSAAGKAA